MITGIGIDLCRISRIERALKSHHFRENVFTPNEISYAEGKGGAEKTAESFAACFAAREAFVKASGISLVKVMTGHEFEVAHNDGVPSVRLSGSLKELAGDVKIMLSLSHEGDYACAVIVIENQRGDLS